MTVLSIISAETNLPDNYLTLVVRTADHRYKSYTVQKPSGGLRTILHPARELKFLQRWVASRVLVAADIHVAATAYHKGASIGFNAGLHKLGAFFLKIDFEDFFPSITIDDVSALLRRLPCDLPEPLSDDDIQTIGKIVTRAGQLVIGAPTSPILANAVMYDFDVAMTNLADQYHCVYSRYADDLVFSTVQPRVLEPVLKNVREHVQQQIAPRLKINEQKVRFTSKNAGYRLPDRS
jgi:RNA-directed DNA polymerase